MKILIFVLSLIFIVNCFAEEIDKPRILIRKTDNQVVGIGYTNFEGINNPQDYKIKEIKTEEMETYLKQIDDNRKIEFQKKKSEEIITQQQKEQEARQILNLTNEQFNKLKEAFK